MPAKEYLRENDLFYSTVYGGGIYKWDGGFVQDPLGGAQEAGQVSPLLVNILTGEPFFIKSVQCDYQRGSFYSRHILNPPKSEGILWPDDMITLSREQSADCGLFVAQEYKENSTPVEERRGNRALLFPYGGYPMMVDGRRKLAQIPHPSWKEPEIRRLAAGILQAIERLNRRGYIYGDIHLSRFLFQEDGNVFLDFSNLVYAFRDIASEQAEELCAPEAGEYPIEFAEPAYVRGTQKVMDFDSQNYSICAMLFFLFFGRYPYDGRLLTGYADDNIQHHYVKFRDYHKMPIFVFDDNDKQNALGAFYEEERVIDLWNECPETLRELFQMTLCTDNAERRRDVSNPPPIVWLQRFQELGWLETESSEGNQ